MLPGQFIPGADSHSRAYGAYGAVGLGVGSTTLGFGWSTGYVYFTLAKARRVVFVGRLNPWVGGKDIVLELLRRWGAKQSQGMSVEFIDRDRQLPMVSRNTIANMMAEAEAQNGIFAADEVTTRWYADKGIVGLPYPPVSPGRDAVYEIDESFDLSAVTPMIAKPFSPGNAFPAEEVARERITFDKALIGSCTNGSYDDLLQAALVIRGARAQGLKTAAREFKVFPGSGGVGREIERPDQRLGGESIAEVFRSAGAVIRQSWCGPCFGQGEDALDAGQRAITSFNRNWQNRMGLGGEGYLASPAVVAASALVGYMAPPSELGLAVGSRGLWRMSLRMTEVAVALVTLTVLEVVLGVDNIIFISILSGEAAEGRSETRPPDRPDRRDGDADPAAARHQLDRQPDAAALRRDGPRVLGPRSDSDWRRPVPARQGDLRDSRQARRRRRPRATDAWRRHSPASSFR